MFQKLILMVIFFSKFETNDKEFLTNLELLKLSQEKKDIFL